MNMRWRAQQAWKEFQVSMKGDLLCSIKDWDNLDPVEQDKWIKFTIYVANICDPSTFDPW